jgi:hypothetical protein
VGSISCRKEAVLKFPIKNLIIAICLLCAVFFFIACHQHQHSRNGKIVKTPAVPATYPAVGMSQTELVRILGLPLRIETYEIRETGTVIRMMDYHTLTVWVGHGKVQRISEKEKGF